MLVFLAVLVFTPTTGWRGHAEWWGWRPSDVFFPAFLLTAGAGLALQARERLPWPRLLRRFVSLLVLGLLFNALVGRGGDLSVLRYPGVLQRIAVVGLAGAAIVALARRSWWIVTVAAVAFAVLWGGMLHHAASGCAGGVATREPVACGTFLDVDVRAFGADHVYRGGTAAHDPEGVASTLGAVASFLIGFAGGRVLVERRARPRAAALALLAMAAAWLAVSPVLRLFAPFGKRLWSPVFVSLNAAVGLAAIAGLVLLLDTAWPQRWAQRLVAVVAWPFEAVGRNALVLWLALMLSDAVFLLTPAAGSGGEPLGNHLVESLGAGWYFIVFFGAWFAVASAMHAARWHVRL